MWHLIVSCTDIFDKNDFEPDPERHAVPLNQTLSRKFEYIKETLETLETDLISNASTCFN